MSFEFNMISWIISSSVLILVVIALRYGLRGRISLRLGYALWLLVLIRLLLPFSFGESSFSVINAAENMPVVRDYQSVREVNAIRQAQSGAVWGEPAYELMPDAPLLVAEHKSEAEFTRLERIISWREAFDLIRRWGMLVAAAVLLISNNRFSARLRRSRQRLDIEGCPLPIYVTEAVETPCLFGLLRPAIYLTPEVAADATMRAHALAHELTHYRHGDHIWALLRCLCLCLHWYNPLVWWAAALSRQDSELACDEGTINRLGEEQRHQYGHTLIDLTCANSSPAALLRTATTMMGSKGSIKERITLIARKPKMAVYTLIAVIIIAAVAVGCTFTGAEQEDSLRKWAAHLAAEDITYAQASQDYGFEQIAHVLSETEIGQLATLFNQMDAYDFSLLDGRGQGVYQLFFANDADESEFICHCTAEGEIFMGFDSRTAARFGAEEKTWWIDSPELYDFIRALVEEQGQPIDAADHDLDVVAAMEEVKAADFVSADGRGYAEGNVTAVALAQALNAAAGRLIADPGQEIIDDFEHGPYPHWHIGYTWRQGGPEDPDGPDRNFRLECGLMENIVRVSLIQGKQGNNAYFEDEALYKLVRHYRDYEEIVDPDAYARFEDILVTQMEEYFALMSEGNSHYTGYELTRFAQVWGYEDQRDGALVELYDFDYALLTDKHPREIVWAGGMYLDSNLRVQGFNGGGQLAVRYRDGQVVGTQFMGNDFYYRPEYNDDEWAIMRLNDALAWAEANSGRMSLIPGGLPLIIFSNKESATPLLTLVADKTWDGKDWVYGEGQGVANDLAAAEAELPELVLADDFYLSFGGNADFGRLSIYDQDYQGQYQTATLNQLNILPPGTWYICLIVTMRGDYIEAAGDYETFSYECAFKLTAP